MKHKIHPAESEGEPLRKVRRIEVEGKEVLKIGGNYVHGSVLQLQLQVCLKNANKRKRTEHNTVIEPESNTERKKGRFNESFSAEVDFDQKHIIQDKMEVSTQCDTVMTLETEEPKRHPLAEHERLPGDLHHTSDFSCFNFWRSPLPDVQLSDVD